MDEKWGFNTGPKIDQKAANKLWGKEEKSGRQIAGKLEKVLHALLFITATVKLV